MQAKPAGNMSAGELSERFPQLVDDLRASDLATRSDAAHALSLWIQRSLQTLTPAELSAHLDWPLLSEIFQFVAENLTDSNPTLTNILKTMLKNLIEVKKKLYPAESFEPWVRFVVDFPSNSKALYLTLEPMGKFMPSSLSWGIDLAFYLKAFPMLSSLQFANPVAKCLAALLCFRGEQDNTTDQAAWLHSWAPLVYDSFLTPYRENVFVYFVPAMLKQAPAVFGQLFRENPSTRLEDRVALLKVAHDLGLDVSVHMDSSITEKLASRSRSQRFEVLSLLVLSKQTSQPVSPATFELIKLNINALLGEPNPKFRNQVFGVFRRLMFRLRASSYALQRDVQKYPEAMELLRKTREFLEWFVRFLSDLLRPGTPYRRLITGCQYFELLAVQGVDGNVDDKFLEEAPTRLPFSIGLFNNAVIRDLINLVPSNYQDVRVAAARLLAMAPAPVAFLDTEADLSKLADESRSLIAGVRGRDGDGGALVARLVYSSSTPDLRLKFLRSILTDTKREVERAEKDVRLAAQEAGIHGYFQTLSLLAEVMGPGHDAEVDDMLLSVRRIWDACKHVLTNSAPEGSVPIPLDEYDDDNTELAGRHGAIGQVILSYAWRALKESVGLLTVLLAQHSFSDADLKATGEMLVEQLTNIRHRGAFSAVAPALQACCTRCYARKELSGLPLAWLDDHFEMIQLHSKLITRRSAGLPLLVTSTLAAHPRPLEPAVDRVMAKLFAIASLPLPNIDRENKLDLPQVHAFNCIKGALWEAQLTKATARHVEPALILAINAFNSPIWSIRNCGVMLFSTLHNRLFGVRGGAMSAKVFFSRFKLMKSTLLDHLLQLMSTSSADLEGVYPVLAVLLRLRAVGGYDGLQPFTGAIVKLLGSPYWKVREMSSWVLENITTAEEKFKIAANLINITSPRHQNQLHGALMTLNALTIPGDSQTEFCELVTNKFAAYSKLYSMEVTVEIVRLLAKAKVTVPLSWLPDLSSKSLNPSARLAKSLLVTMTLEQDSTIALDQLADPSLEVQLAVLAFLETHPEAVTASLFQAVVALALHSQEVDTKLMALRVIDNSVRSGAFVSPKELVESLLSGHNSELVRQAALTISGAAVAKMAADQRVEWLNALRTFADDEEPTSSRLAALAAIERFVQASSPSSWPVEVMYRLYLLVTDDDEDVREAAAILVGNTVGSGADWAPQVCEAKLIELIDPQFLWLQLIGNDHDLERNLATALNTDEALFVVEKQNLYRDYYEHYAYLSKAGRGSVPVPAEVEVVQGRLAQLDFASPLGDSANPELRLLSARIAAITES